MSIGIMLADDHILVRKGIRLLLESEREFQVAAEAGNGKECVEKILAASSSVRLILLDITMPETDGFWALRRIREIVPEMKVIFLTAHREPEIISKAMEMGGDGYLSKSCSFSEIKKAIRSVLNHEKYIQPGLTCVEFSLPEKEGENRQKLEELTDREREILSCVAKGMLNKEIGYFLHISERTVKNHLYRIFRKLDLSDRTQAALFMVRNHVID